MTTRPKRAALKRRLTELSVRKLKPKPASYLIWDTLQRGLAIRVQPTGARAWKCIYSHHGRPRWLHLGDAGAIGLADARMLAAEAMLAVAQGQGPGGREAGRARRRHLRRAGRALRRDATPSSATRAGGRPTPWCGATCCRAGASCRPRHHPRRRPHPDGHDRGAGAGQPGPGGRLARSSRGPSSRRSSPPIPAAGVERNETRSRERVLTDSEVPRFWAAFDDAGLVASSALKTILLTGQRPGEVAHMRHEHIVDGWWEMPGEPVPALRLARHQERREPSGVAAQGGAGTSWRSWATVRPPASCSPARAAVRSAASTPPCATACKKLGVERATPHDLRRTHGTTITALGFGRDAMNRIQNHKEGGIADVYDRSRLCRREQARDGGGRGQDHGAGRGRAERQGRADPALKSCRGRHLYGAIKSIIEAVPRLLSSGRCLKAMPGIRSVAGD